MIDESNEEKIDKEQREYRQIASANSIANVSTVVHGNVEHQVFYKYPTEPNKNQLWYHYNGLIRAIFVKDNFLREFNTKGEKTRDLNLKTGEEEIIDIFPYIIVKVSKRQDLKTPPNDENLVVFEKMEYHLHTNKLKSAKYVTRDLRYLNECWKDIPKKAPLL